MYCLQDYSTRRNPRLDSIITILQQNHVRGHCGADSGSFSSNKRAGVKMAQNGFTQAARKVVVEKRNVN